MLADSKRYITFYGSDDAWMLYDGIGPGGALIARNAHPPGVIDFAAGPDPILWICRPGDDLVSTSIELVRLPGLDPERVTTLNAKLSAIAVSSNGQWIAAVNASPVEGRAPGIMIWNGEQWRLIPSDVKPDISSRLAWIDDHSIAFESQSGNLSVLDLNTGIIEQGPAGCCPATAYDIHRWYALCGGKPVAFNAKGKDRWEYVAMEELGSKNATSLRVTADGEVFTWTEPRFWFGSRTFIQKKGQHRISHRRLKEGTWAVLGPFKR